MPQNSVSEVDLVQAGYFSPVLQTLECEGASVDRLLRQAGLHRFELGEREAYVPVRLMYALFEAIRRQQGIDNVFEVFYENLLVQSISDWGEIIAFTPDVHAACELAIDSIQVLQTHQRMSLEIDGPVAKISQYYLDQPQPGRDLADYIDFCYLLHGLRIAGGDDWEPLEIHLQSEAAPDFDYLLPGNNTTRVRLGQPATAAFFPTSMLAWSMLGEPVQSGEIEAGSPPATLAEAIECLLAASDRGRTAHLDVIADMLELSPRTLRRRLAQQGTTFSEIVDRWRFKSSLGLLERDSLRIGEIAEMLGYGNASNFERAFKRWTGQPPGVYRDSHSG